MATNRGIEIPVNLGDEQSYTKPFDEILKSIDAIESRWAQATTSMADQAKRARQQANADPGPPPITPPPTLYDQYRYMDAQNKASRGQFQDQRDDLLRQAYDAAQANYQQTGSKQSLSQMRSMSGQIGKMDMSFGDKLKDMFMTSRIGLDGGLMPLVNRVTSAFGPQATMAGMALMMVYQAGQMAFQALTGLASKARESTAAGVSLGSQTAFGGLAGYGSMFDPIAMAQKLQSSIQQGGAAGSYASGLGINIMGGPFGDLNLGKKLNKVLDDIARSGTFDQAVRKANMLGVPELANAYYLSPVARANIGYGAGLGEKEKGGFATFEANLAVASNAFVTLAQTITANSNLFKAVNFYLGYMGAYMNTVTKGLQWMASGLDEVIKWIEDKLKIKIGGRDENTQALKENTRALKDHREMMGGGPRAQSAIPGKVGGLSIANPAVREALEYGFL